MGIFKKRKFRNAVGGWISLDDTSLCVTGYTSLDHNPEILTGCRRIAELIGSMTIHLMSNTENGDVRIINELSRKIDIDPMPTMTRKTWMEAIVMNMLLYGKGNSIVVPHTKDGIIDTLEPIAAGRVTFNNIGYSNYTVLIDGISHDPQNLLHFVLNPDKTFLWKGRGLTVSLLEVASNLKQAAATKKGFLESKWKPSIIVKVDALTDEFSSLEGRRKLRESYLETSEVGEPWLIPAEQFDIKEVRPLSLADLAINDSVELDKKTVAAILGIPPFLLGVGQYDQEAWNNFIQNTIRPMALGIQQEMTRKLIISPKWYLKFNTLSLMDWDLNTIASVFGALSDRAIVTGNEVRDRLGMSPVDGLDELRLLENYVPLDKIGDQKKLVQDGDDE